MNENEASKIILNEIYRNRKVTTTFIKTVCRENNVDEVVVNSLIKGYINEMPGFGDWNYISLNDRGIKLMNDKYLNDNVKKSFSVKLNELNWKMITALIGFFMLIATIIGQCSKCST
jgi:hypothetical protein